MTLPDGGAGGTAGQPPREPARAGAPGFGAGYASRNGFAPQFPRPWWRRCLSWLRQDLVTHLAPLVAVLLFLAVIVSAFWYLRLEEMRREREAVKRDVEYGQERLRQRLLQSQEQLMRLARDVANRQVDSMEFVLRAESLLTQSPELMAVSWIDQNQRLVAIRASPSIGSARDWLARGALKSGAAQSGYDQARLSLQPVYSQPAAVKAAETELQLHVPIRPEGQFAGELLAEYSVDALLRYGLPPEIMSKYATALLNAKGQILAGQSIPARAGLSQHLPWAGKVNESEIAVAPVGSDLLLRVQAWRTAQGLIGRTLLWMVAALAALTTWMLLANWRQWQRRQQAQSALQAETSFRRAMENSMLTGMRALDMQGRIIYVNPAFCQMTGWSEEELIGQSEPFAYWPDDDRQSLSAYLAQELRGAASAAGFQMRVKRKDGSLFDARLYVSPLIDGGGKQTGWMASMTDITEPNRVRQQLSASYERFTTVLEALDASVSVAPLGSEELLFANKLYRQWFDGTTDGHMGLLERAGTPETSAPPGENQLDAVDALAGLPLGSLAGSPAAAQAEIYIEGLGKWLEVRSRYLNWVDGRLAQMVIATDITVRRRAEELAAAQLERAQAANRLITMGEMASSVAHEINQPLTAINNYCTGMISRLKGGAIEHGELLGALEKTARQAQRAGQVVQHIRGFVRRSEPRRQSVQVPEIVDQVVELAEIELRRRQVRLAYQVEPDLPALLADPILIELVLLNLIKNGAESIEAAGVPPGNRVVSLHVTRREAAGAAAVQFAVSDTGRGLEPGVVSRLYEAFFSTKSEGLGVGLNLCRSIIESHQGRIQADNLYNAGQIAGCVFSFWIPAGPSPNTPRPSRASGKVLA